MTEHERNLTDLAAIFAMGGLIMRGEPIHLIADKAYLLAEDLMAVREEKIEQVSDEEGIAAIKPKRKYERKSTS